MYRLNSKHMKTSEPKEPAPEQDEANAWETLEKMIAAEIEVIHMREIRNPHFDDIKAYAEAAVKIIRAHTFILLNAEKKEPDLEK